MTIVLDLKMDEHFATGPLANNYSISPLKKKDLVIYKQLFNV